MKNPKKEIAVLTRNIKSALSEKLNIAHQLIRLKALLENDYRNGSKKISVENAHYNNPKADGTFLFETVVQDSSDEEPEEVPDEFDQSFRSAQSLPMTGFFSNCFQSTDDCMA
eukprot:TRINITY_DN1657_c0_g1_i8.p1 TRINITY_DN1657_c0_g1~~TRINITY_DN1657_c0_g1_i8.p1  ORF type:complete len:113 (-),score=17.21 TRINITY_DN1657_c0_g1_i8:76-414(-)